MADAPAKIGPYRLLAPLGRGGMGVVYRAEHEETGALVALKTVGVTESSLLSSIRREIHALRRIDHPGVVRIVGEGVEGGLPWYAMELLGGSTLRDHNTERWRNHTTVEALLSGMGSRFSVQETDVALTGAEGLGSGGLGAGAGGEDEMPEDPARTGPLLGPTRGVPPAPRGERLQVAAKEVSGPMGLPTPPTRVLPAAHAAASGAPAGSGRRGGSGGSEMDAPGGGEMPMRTFTVAASGELPQALTLFRAICKPLAYIHGLGLVHRDLKPENVFVREDGSPVLVDFGLAVKFEGTKGRGELELQFGGKPMGSPAYMAPEQVRGDLVDARADLYALGCMLYEAVTGSVPFMAANAALVLSMHLYATPLPPSSLVEGVPPALDALLMRLLQKRPEDRLGYADDVAAALGALGGDDIDLVAAPAWQRAPKPQPYLYRPGLAGRGEALRTLHGLLRRLQEGHGGIAFLAGESGIGKTRLAMEVATEAARLGIAVVTGECIAVSAGDGAERSGVKGAPLHPLRHLLLAVADRCRAAGFDREAPSAEPDEARMRATYDALLGPRGRLLSAYEPALAQLPGHERYPDPPPLPADAASFRLRSAVMETLAALSGEGPLLLVLDDLQWADDSTLGVLELLDASFFEENRALVLGTYRSEEASTAVESLIEAPGVLALHIGRLDGRGLSRMVSDMLAMDRPPDAFVGFLQRQSEGNPFFTAEYLRAAVQEGLLYRDGLGAWRLRGPGARESVAAGSTTAGHAKPESVAGGARGTRGTRGTPESRAPGSAVAGARTTDPAGPGSVAPGSGVPGSATPRSEVPASVAPGSMMPGSVAPGSVAPGSVVPGSIVPGSVVPGSIVPGSVVPGSIVPGSVVPGSIVPGSVVPGSAAAVAAAMATAVEVRGPASVQGEPSSAVEREWAALALPSSLRELVSRRLAGLSPGAQQLLRMASVLGRELEEVVLVSAAGVDDLGALEGLAELSRRHVLEPAEPGRLRFVHDKLREIAYGEIADEEKLRLHRAAALALEARFEASPDLPLAYPQLAHHFAMAGATDKALEYLERAGDQALTTGASGEARGLFLRALALDGARPEEARAAKVRRARWERRLAEASYNLGDLREAELHCVKALGLLERPVARVFAGRGAQPAALSVLTSAALSAWQLGRQLLHLGGVAIPRATRGEERDRLAEAALTAELLSETYLFQNQAAFAFMAAVEATNAAAGLGPSAALARGYATLSVAFGYVPWETVVDAYARRAEQTAAASHDAQAGAFVAFMRGLTALGEGRCRDARGLLEKAEHEAERVGNRRRQEECIALLGTAAHLDGAWAEALGRFAALQSSARRSNNAQGLVWAHSGRAQTLILLGEGTEAVELLEELIVTAEKSGDRAQQITLGQIALAHLLQGDRAAALRTAERTLGLLKAQGKPAAFHCLHGYVATGEVLLEAWETASTVEARERFGREARQACAALRLYARVFPLGIPDALRIGGVAAWLMGRPRSAIGLWEQSAAEAARMGLPVHEGLARLEMRRLPAHDVERERDLGQAQEIFARLGIAHLERQARAARG
ncbi:serine/threonine-protein kinase [Chondromyces apiculatus]|uniref:Serine/threonine protein kinase n=1 Tax=Chondromyces apiculatus DSM 436 TaxID=1192034 RepID=A0A017SVP5_9BACT|nr:AAA family ATPase [Chondromyces apiculatus]EYF01028.1 Serine/threonine protein kinase [Chondromyces apiculatus DSM 436]